MLWMIIGILRGHFLHALNPVYEPVEVEMIFNRPNTPFILTQIENHTILQLLDLGASLECGLKKEILAKINKEVFSQCVFMTANGVIKEEAQFIIPEIQIGSLIINPVIVNEKTGDCSLDEDGVIGNKILEKTNLLLDFPNNKVIFIRDVNCKTINHYQIMEWVKVPFEWHSVGMILDVETNLGLEKYLLDTGATHNFIYYEHLQEQAPQLYNEQGNQIILSKFILGNHDFGQQKFIKLKNLVTFVNEQGVIGVEFLKQHVIFIDYPNKMLYIKNEK